MQFAAASFFELQKAQAGFLDHVLDSDCNYGNDFFLGIQYGVFSALIQVSREFREEPGELWS